MLKGSINFNRKIGQNALDDGTLVDFIQNLEKIPLRDEDFEFPDLLGAAYEWLIKHFADSVGKKAGEFYTPVEVVLICIADASELSLNGQEKMGTTWSICKMNMLLHGILFYGIGIPACIAAIENLWSKYAVTAKQIEAERDKAAKELQAFLAE